MHCAAALVSILKNTNAKCLIHILHDDRLQGKARNNLQLLCEHYNQQIEFYQIQEIDRQFESLVPQHFGIGTLYRLDLPKMLDVEKVIYLDCDICCNMDINELWTYPENPDKPFLSWVKDENNLPDKKNRPTYCNAGVMLMYLERIRKKLPDLRKAVLRTLLNYKEPSTHPDQDGLNTLFEKLPVQYLPEKFNFQIHIDQRWLLNSRQLQGKILHYCMAKPWNDPSFPAAFIHRENYLLLNDIIAKQG